MNECPTCGRMIKGSICHYCDEELLEEGGTEAVGVTGEDLADVFRCRTQAQADFITSLLESEGIPAFQAPGDSLDGGRRSARARGVSIQVEEEDAARALQIIESAKDDLETQEE
ncbi:MAG: DUF2007 domain-containing protein [bacterium]